MNARDFFAFPLFHSLLGCRGDTIDINKRLRSGALDIVDRLFRYVRDFAPSDPKAVLFADNQLTLPGKEHQQLLVVFRAVLAASLAGR